MTNKTLTSLKDKVAKDLYKMTPTEAHTQQICISCKSPIHITPSNPTGQPGNIYSQPGRDEYLISALCETCFDNLFPQE